MNNNHKRTTRPTRKRHHYASVISLLIVTALCGCKSGDKTNSTSVDMQTFNDAGPVTPMMDLHQLKLAARPVDEYRLVSGDILELYMPDVLGTIKDDLLVTEERKGYHLTRVESTGKIVVPLIGRITGTAKTVREIEEELKALYYPKFVKLVPSIVGKVSQYQTHPVKIIGAIEKPGIYDLKHNEMSLVTLLAKAGGITEGGAGAIRISYADRKKPIKTLLLPVKHMDIPFADLELQPGDLIEVLRLSEQAVTVVGLVVKPGIYPIPPETQYSLLQGIALAGGLNTNADPHWARVFRRGGGGALVWHEFRVSGKHNIEGADVVLKPGDIVAVQNTWYTSTRTLFAQIFRVGFGITFEP